MDNEDTRGQVTNDNSFPWNQFVNWIERVAKFQEENAQNSVAETTYDQGSPNIKQLISESGCKSMKGRRVGDEVNFGDPADSGDDEGKEKHERVR